MRVLLFVIVGVFMIGFISAVTWNGGGAVDVNFTETQNFFNGSGNPFNQQVNSTDNVTFNNVNVTDNVSATFFIGDGSQLTNLPTGDNTSWTQALADTLYADIQWDYNQTLVLTDNSILLDIANITNFVFNYNQTYNPVDDSILLNIANITNFLYNYNQTYTPVDDSILLNIANITNFDFNYNQSNANLSFNQALTDTLYADIQWDYNQSDGVGNSSWTQALADTLYADIQWDYNQTTVLTDNSILLDIANITNFVFNYNQTYTGGTFNATYDIWAYNQSNANLSFNQALTDTLYAGIEWDYNQTLAVTPNNDSWNQSYADTLYADIQWDYNQTTVLTDNSILLDIANITNFVFNYNQSNANLSFNQALTDTLYADIQWDYNQSDGVGNTSWNESYANTLYADIQWGYNQSDGSYNVTYDEFAYNQTTQIGIFQENVTATTVGGGATNVSTTLVDFLITQITVIPTTSTTNYRFEATEFTSGDIIDKDRKKHVGTWDVEKSYAIDDKIFINITDSSNDELFTVEIKYVSAFLP